MKKLEFPGHDGGMLAGRLDEPEGTPKAYILFAHCFTCTKDVFGASRIAKKLVDEGFAVFRFDFTGLGASEGDFSNTNFTSNVEDLKKAATYLEDNYEAPKIMVGHSLGGTATLVAASQLDHVNAVVTLGSPADAAHVAHHFKDHKDQILKEGEAEVCLVGRPFVIKKQFLEDIEAQHMEFVIGNLKRPLLVMHAPTDQTVGIDNAAQIYGWAKHPKSFISLDNADHLLSKKEDAEYAAMLIATWSARYIS